jgi:hypothetical protein
MPKRVNGPDIQGRMIGAPRPRLRGGVAHLGRRAARPAAWRIGAPLTPGERERTTSWRSRDGAPSSAHIRNPASVALRGRLGSRATRVKDSRLAAPSLAGKLPATCRQLAGCPIGHPVATWAARDRSLRHAAGYHWSDPQPRPALAQGPHSKRCLTPPLRRQAAVPISQATSG